MSLHCFLAGHDVDNHARELSDKCVHCGVSLPIDHLRIASEAVLRGLAVIAFIAFFTGVRFVRESTRPKLEPELVESQDR